MNVNAPQSKLRQPEHRRLHKLLMGTLSLGLLSLSACGSDRSTPTADAAETDAATDAAPDTAPEDAAQTDAPTDTAPDVQPYAWPAEATVIVTLDGAPQANVVVMQAGTTRRTQTDDDGRATLAIQQDLGGDLVVTASHPDARIGNHTFTSFSPAEPTIALTRFDRSDNAEYPWQDPGEPRDSPTTAQCGHCHQTINADWAGSPHRSAASNIVVQDLFRGVAFGHDSEAACAAAGGRWQQGPARNSANPEGQCFIGTGVVTTLNDCADGFCDNAEQFGACADCHAPAIGPNLGGHDLRSATDLEFAYGVFCDVCHRTESVHPELPAGAAGRLAFLRPSEPRSGPLGPFQPLTFGPSHDSPNPRMGSVQRDHFRDGTLCVGCHELEQQVLVPGASIDADRWPSERLPIHTTFSEWEQGPLGAAVPCNACHMPPVPNVLNAADVQLFPLTEFSITGGWFRPAGEVRAHSWVGPRTPSSGMLQLAAALFVDTTLADGQLTVAVRTKNVGPAHAIPTGEPLRALLLQVSATCDGTPLVATGGDVVPDFGGAEEMRDADAEWTLWPNAAVGDALRVVARPGGFVDYNGFGRFGDGADSDTDGDTFDAEAKGIPVETLVGEVTITAVGADGALTLSAPLPDGDRVYRVRTPQELAGAPGFGFARVLTGVDGARMVPHFEAVDVASDNRILPQESWTSTHVFAAPCETPRVSARLIHRPLPLALARQRGWTENDSVTGDQVMAEVMVEGVR